MTQPSQPTPLPDWQGIIDRFYPAGTRLRDIFMTHSRSVADLALELAKVNNLPLDPDLIEAAAMLHDIGIFLTHAPSIACTGSEPYIRHGILGAALLREAGAGEMMARVAELHTGSGLTSAEITQQKLPLPARDYLPSSLLEKLICYADKFYSKSGDMKRKNFDRVRGALAAKNSSAAERFDSLAGIFGRPANT